MKHTSVPEEDELEMKQDNPQYFEDHGVHPKKERH